MNPMVFSSPNIVTAAEMQAIESRMFEGGIPVAALMEKVGLLLTQKIEALLLNHRDFLWPIAGKGRISVLVGPGHNGGDALVVARELWEKGYTVKLFKPLDKAKPLTEAHSAYTQHLRIPYTPLSDWLQTDVILDGLFGFGLIRPILGELAALIQQINQSNVPIISIDLPSGLHADTGEILGTAIAAGHTFCLGLWKRAFFQEQALNCIGKAHLLPFGIPESDQSFILGPNPKIQMITVQKIQSVLNQQRPKAIHKYEVGGTLLICGSSQYPGAAILAAKAAQASGVGMLYVAVPKSFKNLVVAQVPDAIVIACPETSRGAIAKFPDDFSFEKVKSVAIGPGLTSDARTVLDQCLSWELPLVLDADALNILGNLNWHPMINQRTSPTVLTPHWGEFKRLFPEYIESEVGQNGDRISLLLDLSAKIKATIVLKGAKTLITQPDHSLLINAVSSSALARGGSGDVLTGILGGLLAQYSENIADAIACAVWWHAQSAVVSAQTLTQGGVDPQSLIDALNPYRRQFQNA